MSTNNIIGRKITVFRFKSMGDILWHEAMEDYIGQIGKILFRHDAVNTVLVLFPDGRLCRYPLSLIEQHLVPESGGEPESNRWLFTEDEVYTAMNWMKHQYDKALDSPAPNYPLDFTTKEGGDEFMKRLDKAGIDLEKFMLSLAKNGAEARAQSIVNAEAYRVENERLRKALYDLRMGMNLITNSASLPLVQEYAKNAIEDIDKALSQNT